MSQQPRADIIVTADDDTTVVERCLQNLLVHSGSSLRRLIVIDDDSTDPDMAVMLGRLVTIDSRLHLVRNSSRGSIRLRYGQGLRQQHQAGPVHV